MLYLVFQPNIGGTMDFDELNRESWIERILDFLSFCLNTAAFFCVVYATFCLAEALQTLYANRQTPFDVTDVQPMAVTSILFAVAIVAHSIAGIFKEGAKMWLRQGPSRWPMQVLTIALLYSGSLFFFATSNRQSALLCFMVGIVWLELFLADRLGKAIAAGIKTWRDMNTENTQTTIGK